MSEEPCPCLDGPLQFDQYQLLRQIGVDRTNGRFGEVSLRRCLRCGRTWLHYLVEYEFFTGSGRFFMGLISPDVADALAPEDAVAYLDRLDWHLFGGSYFGRKGRSGNKIDV